MFKGFLGDESEKISDSFLFFDDILNVNNLRNTSFSTERDVIDNQESEDNIITSTNFSFLSFDEKEQNTKSTKNDTNTQKTINSNCNNSSYEQSSEPDLYKFKKIQELLVRNKFNEIIEYFKSNNLIQTEENLLSGGRKKRENGYNSLLNRKRSKRGRKIQENEKPPSTDHNKFSPNNIIIKIKVKFFDGLKNFMNKMLNKAENDKNGLYNLSNDYKIKIERDFNLDLLNMKLKDLLSKDITTKYKKNSNYNKILIENILNEKEKVEDLNTIKFVFNLTFKEWIDLFSYKITIDDLKKKYKKENHNVNFEKIDENKGDIVNLFKNILDKNNNNKEYLSYFIFCLYNYERWFFVKKNANKNNSKESKSLIINNTIIDDVTE